MANEYWLNDEQWVAIEPLIPTKRRGVKPGRNREVKRGILHVLKFGCRWRDCPEVYGPHTTIYNRSNRCSKAGILAGVDAAEPCDDGGSGSAMHRHLQGTPMQRRRQGRRRHVGHRPQPRRTHDQNPCRLRPCRTIDFVRYHAALAWRYASRSRSARNPAKA
jgi:transposase